MTTFAPVRNVLKSLASTIPLQGDKLKLIAYVSAKPINWHKKGICFQLFHLSKLSNPSKMIFTSLTPLICTPRSILRPKRHTVALLVGYEHESELIEDKLRRYLLSLEAENIFEKALGNTCMNKEITMTRASSAAFRLSPFLKQGFIIILAIYTCAFHAFVNSKVVREM